LLAADPLGMSSVQAGKTSTGDRHALACRRRRAGCGRELEVLAPLFATAAKATATVAGVDVLVPRLTARPPHVDASDAPACASNSPPRAGRACEARDQVDAGDSSPPPAAAISTRR
jgi:hypothetical protein